VITKEQLEAIVTDNNVRKLEPAVLSPPQLLQQALASGAGIEVIERLMGLRERWEDNEARKAFSNAVAAFKADPDKPKILKKVEVEFEGRQGGRTSYKHEDLADLLAAVDPALAKYGLWVRYKVWGGVSEPINCVCILGHRDGHSEESEPLRSAPDTSGNKNPLQGIGSAVSYLQRYTLKAALGLAAAKDDDGVASSPRNGVISDKQADIIREKLKGFTGKSVDSFLTKAGALSVSDIMSVKYDSCIRYLDKQIEAKEAKK